MPTPHDEELGESATLAAIRSSVQGLDADPGAAPTTGFRNRGRSALRASMPAAGSGRSFHPRRLAIVGVTILLFGLIAMPALAGPGAIANGVSGAANAVGQMFGNGRSHHDAQDSDGTNATPDHPDNHGAGVSAAAHSTPEDGEPHGEQVRTVARDNHGHEVNDSSKGTSGSNDEQESSKNGSASGSEENHGQQVRAVAQDNHGADVSAAAHNTPADGTKHGEQVSDVARDNHGADVSAAAHSTATSGEDHGKQSSSGTNDNQGNR